MKNFGRQVYTINFLVFLLVVGLGLAACGGETNETPVASDDNDATVTEVDQTSDEPLVILEWSGYDAIGYPHFFAPFTSQYSEQLEELLSYSFFAEDAEAFAKMQSGFHADLVHPCNSWWQLYVDQGLVQPIDTSRLSNWSGIQADFAQMGQFNGEQYFIPWDWGYESMLVRTDLVPEVPDSWADLWDEQYAGHVVLWDSGESNYAITALALGLDPWNTTPEDDERIKQKLLELKPNLLTYWTDYTEAYELPTGDDAWIVVNAWQDAYAYVDSEGFDVTYVQPEEGRLGWVCGFGIGADAVNLDLIYEYLDAAIDPESMAAFANEYWYGSANLDAIPLIDEYIVDFMELGQAESLTERTVLYQPLTEEQRQTRVDLWDEVKASP
ncbi:MAG: ABC transporter substrate-binding protein [Chloroflexi bacterium]|nr:ABC transporter substrate-binding protein [Chloroflexota bacterium]